MIKFNPGIQVWSTYKKLIYHINRTKTNHMISIDEEKKHMAKFNAISNKNTNKVGIKENFLISIKDIYERPVTNILMM